MEPPFYQCAPFSYWHPPFSVSFTLTITIVDENIIQVHQKYPTKYSLVNSQLFFHITYCVSWFTRQAPFPRKQRITVNPSRNYIQTFRLTPFLLLLFALLLILLSLFFISIIILLLQRRVKLRFALILKSVVK